MVNPHMINVEVVYANPQQQAIIALQVAPGITAIEAIKKSGILARFPEINLDNYKMGIFSKIISVETILQEGDRVEIYHPLLIDPKIVRKQRAKKQKQLK